MGQEPGRQVRRSAGAVDEEGTFSHEYPSGASRGGSRCAALRGTPRVIQALDVLESQHHPTGRPSIAVRIVRLGSDRVPNEGLRIGTVRRPPRGVPKSQFASGNWYDVWFPNLAPSPEAVKLGLSAQSEREWRAFEKRYRSEMANTANSRVLDLLAALSHEANFAVGCYCEDESRCHRSILCELLRDRGATVI